MPVKSSIWDISDTQFKKIVKESIFYSDVAVKVGYKTAYTNNRVIKKRIKQLGLDISHFQKGKRKKIPLKDICVKNSTYTTTHLKKRLFKELNWEHKCSFCNLKE